MRLPVVSLLRTGLVVVVLLVLSVLVLSVLVLLVLALLVVLPSVSYLPSNDDLILPSLFMLSIFLASGLPGSITPSGSLPWSFIFKSGSTLSLKDLLMSQKYHKQAPSKTATAKDVENPNITLYTLPRSSLKVSSPFSLVRFMP